MRSRPNLSKFCEITGGWLLAADMAFLSTRWPPFPYETSRGRVGITRMPSSTRELSYSINFGGLPSGVPPHQKFVLEGTAVR